MRNVVLIGFMGTGKSTVGRRLAHILRRPFLDTDAEIERLVGKPVQRIFAEDGETRFRAEEALLCRELAEPRGLIIATGGGLVLNPENVRHLRAGGILVGLRAGPAVIYNRVRRNPHRPLLQEDVRARIDKLLRERAGAYNIAEFTVDTGKYGSYQAVRLILAYLKERNYRGPRANRRIRGPKLPDRHR